MKLLTVEEVAEMLGMSRERVYQLTREGIIPVVKIGRSLKYSEKALIEWIENGGKSYPGGWKKEA